MDKEGFNKFQGETLRLEIYSTRNEKPVENSTCNKKQYVIPLMIILDKSWCWEKVVSLPSNSDDSSKERARDTSTIRSQAFDYNSRHFTSPVLDHSTVLLLCQDHTACHLDSDQEEQHPPRYSQDASRPRQRQNGRPRSLDKPVFPSPAASSGEGSSSIPPEDSFHG